MKLLIFIFSSLLSLKATAQTCYLAEEKDQAGDYVLYRVKGYTPKNVICKIEGECPKGTTGSDIKQEIITVNEKGEEVTLIDHTLKALGLKQLLENERLRCTVDTDKRGQRIEALAQAIEQEKQERLAKENARKQAIERFVSKCKEENSKHDKDLCDLIELLEE